MGGWGIIIAGLVFLLIYAPIGIVILIIGAIVLAVGKGNKVKSGGQGEKKCPKCAEMVKSEAIVCRFCNYEFPPEEVREMTDKQKAKERIEELRHKLHNDAYILSKEDRKKIRKESLDLMQKWNLW